MGFAITGLFAAVFTPVVLFLSLKVSLHPFGVSHADARNPLRAIGQLGAFAMMPVSSVNNIWLA